MRLDNRARMNTPGKAAGNWAWRVGDVSVSTALVTHVLACRSLCGRQCRVAVLAGFMPIVETRWLSGWRGTAFGAQVWNKLSKEAAELKSMAETYDRLPPRVQNAKTGTADAAGNGAVHAEAAAAPEPATVKQ